MWYIIFLILWVVLLSGLKIGYDSWRKWRFCQPARYVSEIKALRYYQNLNPELFSRLIMEGLKQHQYTLLGNPIVGASREQGFAWKSGKRAVIAPWLEKPLTANDLNQLAIKQSRVKAERVLVFSPFAKAPLPVHNGIEVLAGEKLLSWFSVLSATRPPVSGKIASPACGSCGSPMDERVNRAGLPLFVCSRYPDCKGMHQPDESEVSSVGAR
jgi:hypothetical protein